MQSRIWMGTTAVCLFAALSLPARLVAFDDHDHPATFTTFDVPGAFFTAPISINPKGSITGVYGDTNGVLHGFLRDCEEKDCEGGNGMITTFDVPGSGTGQSQGTSPLSINPRGAITGSYVDAKGLSHGFLRECNRDDEEKECERDNIIITTFDVPGSGTVSGHGTFPVSINPKGAITGSYLDATFLSHGFLWDCDRDDHEKDCEGGNRMITTFDVPGAGTFLQTIPVSINPEGEITGYNLDATGQHGFLRATDGTITKFDAPGTDRGTIPRSINPKGAITGSYADANFVGHGFLRAPDGTITTFDVPFPTDGTSPIAINPNGAITGSWFDPSGGHGNLGAHGFLRTSDGMITTFDVPGSSAVLGMGTSPQGINAKGAITGSYFDGNTLRGFLLTQACDRECDEDN